MSTMSGPATRPNGIESSEVEYIGPVRNEPEPVILPQYEARFSVERDNGESIVSVTVVGSPRIVDQIMHSATDAFREEVEP